ncbi:MAG: ATP-dependent DNA helicase [Propionivibrio sp.]|uniref:DNA 5'-3' helicase n=1 Tax=Candidatus Propionivibrio dominans TaxID=2954373 RepID=A0A9D7FFA9_9RHOO|nr:ATP-dependent DNA helicase [Candidatus Propionivibrio dominans]
MTPSIQEAFSADGPLASGIPGYRLRAQQIEMAERIAAAMADNSVLVAEAGTGTGKTFAYLVPALLSGGKVIVSTGTKNLQDQLFSRDIPTVRKALGSPVKVALLKGRANYVCHYHLERSLADGRFLSREDSAHAVRISRFARKTKTGDKAECADVPESSPVWSMVTSTRENCLGQDCPSHKDCFVLAARREALAADLVVVNHHLFFADVMLRDEGTAELLPACNAVIFDEAHQLPETASLFFGDNVSTAQILDLVRDARIEGLASARDCLDLPKLCGTVEKSARDLRLTLPVEPSRFALLQLAARMGFDNGLLGLMREVEALAALLETQAQRSEGLENCWRRAGELLTQMRRWQGGADTDYVRWGETYTHALQLNATPLVIAKIMQKQMSGHPRAWIFTSATLAVQRDFAHYCAEMGLDRSESAFWDSPFDYPRQALLYAPQSLPDPNSHGFAEAVVQAAFPVLKASGGRAFFLCTSLRAMRRTHELLSEQLERAGLDFPLLLQGEGSKNELLERFRRLGNAILVGSQSFWEGVDVRGDALSVVVIDKLPFAPPDDPVLSARIERMKNEGRNAFMDYQLPRAVINVKQGAGRLIRDETDRGVLMICDPRLISKPYGKRIWRSLPPMKRTRELDEVLAFFELS